METHFHAMIAQRHSIRAAALRDSMDKSVPSDRPSAGRRPRRRHCPPRRRAWDPGSLADREEGIGRPD